MKEKPPYRQILNEIANVVSDTGLRVGDLSTWVQYWIDPNVDGDDLGGSICKLTTGEYVNWHNNDRVELRGRVLIAAYAR